MVNGKGIRGVFWYGGLWVCEPRGEGGGGRGTYLEYSGNLGCGCLNWVGKGVFSEFWYIRLFVYYVGGDHVPHSPIY